MKENIILVCITDMVDGEKLIKEGRRMADKGKLKLKILNIQNSKQSKNIKDTKLEYLFGVCKFLDVDMQVYWGNNFSDIVINYISRNKINQLLLGKIPKSEQDNFLSKVKKTFPSIQVFITE
ncbi:hypothetical protein [Clostridium thailandense]|uniref:Universal stress protein n=1 Tax=Clostridium thailandense TaxID=2794346 RepID=A0A949TS74_9CLOT|nr:hypothetical protein [Clostridium thailandense]MBV7274407.1 hypothetical protein [Clostridium thailandense]